MWYRFAVARLLSNPIVGGFYVDGDLIEYGKEFGITEWAKILGTDTKKIFDQDNLDNFLKKSKYEEIDGKKTYIPAKRGGQSLELKNPIDEFYVKEKIENQSGGFWVSYKLIEKNQILGVLEWMKLLSTRSGLINSDEKLLNFLNDSNFEFIDGKKTYVPKVRNLFINNLFDFYVIDKFSGEEKPISLGISYTAYGWASLLGTKQKNISSQENLDNFLNNGFFKNIDGKKIYSGQKNISRRKPITEQSITEKPATDYISKEKILINNYDDFYVKNENSEFDLIELGKTGNISFWSKVLSKNMKYVNDQDKLNNILQDFNFNLNDGKKYYIPQGQKILLQNNFDLFYIGNLPVPRGQKYGKHEWARLLRTNFNQVSSQSNLDLFLGDERRYEIIDGMKTYIRKASGRERFFERKFENYNRDEIVVKSQQDIIVTDSINKHIKNLRLDFAFKNNDKILLAVEINGIQHYAFAPFVKSKTYDQWQNALNHDVLKINYCHNNNIPLLIFNHMLSQKQFESMLNNLHQNPHIYDRYIPQPVMDNNVTNTSEEFIKRQIYSHLYPVFNNVISFENDESRKRYIKDTLILIAKLVGIYEGGIDKTDYIKSFNIDVDLTANYNKCLAIYNNLYPDYPLDFDNKITYSDLSKKPKLYKPKQIEEIPSEE